MEAQLQLSKTDRLVSEKAGAGWDSLYSMAGAAALVSLIFFPIQIAIFFIHPYPTDVTGWFALLNSSPLVGLIELDLLIVVDEVLVILIFLALCLALRKLNPSLMLVSAVMGVISAVLYIVTNPAFGMLDLSKQYFLAASEIQRNSAVAAGQSLMAGWIGTGWEAAYVLGSVAPILISAVMLRSKDFRKASAWLGIVANVVALGIFVPTVGTYISIFSVVILWAWYVFIGLDLLKLGRSANGEA